MPHEKYRDFKISTPFTRDSKQSNAVQEKREYVSITCPHCQTVFAEITVETIAKMKPTKCLKHLRVCTSFEGDLVPKKSSTPFIADGLNEDSMAEVKAQMTAMKEENETQLMGMQEQIADLQQHKNMINNVLMAVAPSIREMLPLEGPEQKAKLTLTNAMIQDFPRLMPPGQMIIMQEDSSLPGNLMYRMEYEERMRAHAVKLESYEEQLKRKSSELEEQEKKISGYKQTIDDNETEIRRLKKERETAMEKATQADAQRVVLENQNKITETKLKMELKKKREREKISKQMSKVPTMSHILQMSMEEAQQSSQKRPRL